MGFYRYANDLISLFFPEVCLGCNRPLVSQEKYICTHCSFHLPYTNFHLDAENIACKRFWGRIPLKAAASYLYFSPGSLVQQILHNIKYKNRPHAATFLGKQYGLSIKKTSSFNNIDLIIPVPLHQTSHRQRAYN